MTELKTVDAKAELDADPIKGAKLVNAAFEAFGSTQQGKNYILAPDGSANEIAQYWLEKLKAGDHQEPGTPVFHLAVTVDTAGKVHGLATSDYYIEGPKGGKFGQPAYNVVLDPKNAEQIEEQLRQVEMAQLRATAGRVGGGVLRGLAEEDDGNPLFKQAVPVESYAQAPDPKGNKYHQAPIKTLRITPLDDKSVAAIAESAIHAQHLYFNGKTIDQAKAAGTLDPDVEAALHAAIMMRTPEETKSVTGRILAERRAAANSAGTTPGGGR